MRRWPAILGGAALLLVILAGAAWAGILVARGDATALPADLRSAAASPSDVTPSAVSDPHGRDACRLIAQANADGSVLNPGVVESINAAAAQAEETGIRFAGQMLVDLHELAVASKGQADEFRTKLNVTTYALETETKCINLGLMG